MIIAGGTYEEVCDVPQWDAIYGSGGRAAAALSGFGIEIQLHTFAAEEAEESIRAAMNGFSVSLNIHRSDRSFVFHYFHTLSQPRFYEFPAGLDTRFEMRVKGDVVLRFGFMEGSAIVDARVAVYDPQSSTPVLFSGNGSTAQKLAYVLNKSELIHFYPGADVDTAAQMLLANEQAEVVLVKQGAFGVRVITTEGAVNVSAYQTSSLFKIGSGDVFSAAFTYYWGVLDFTSRDAAVLASRATAWYCDTRSLPLPDDDLLSALKPVPLGKPGRIYLAGPFFTVAQRWLIEEVRAVMVNLGADVFSPLHEVGWGKPHKVAPADLEGLYSCQVVLALIDGSDVGTIFELGYAKAFNKPAIVFTERLQDYQLTMITGSDYQVISDLALAIYKAAWASI